MADLDELYEAACQDRDEALAREQGQWEANRRLAVDAEAYEFLRDGIVDLLDPPDGDDAEEAILVAAVRTVRDERDRYRALLVALWVPDSTWPDETPDDLLDEWRTVAESAP